jgi:nickel transport protein
MKPRACIVLSLAALWLTAFDAHAHTVNYAVEQKNVAALRVFYTADDPANYAEYEVFAPDAADLPHQTGRTDRNGFLSFIPDRPGAWKVKVLGESAHGYHGVTIAVKVDKDLNLESFKKPLAPQYLKVVTGVSLIIGVFGIYGMITSRAKQKHEQV